MSQEKITSKKRCELMEVSKHKLMELWGGQDFEGFRKEVDYYLKELKGNIWCDLAKYLSSQMYNDNVFIAMCEFYFKTTPKDYQEMKNTISNHALKILNFCDKENELENKIEELQNKLSLEQDWHRRTKPEIETMTARNSVLEKRNERLLAAKEIKVNIIDNIDTMENDDQRTVIVKVIS